MVVWCLDGLEGCLDFGWLFGVWMVWRDVWMVVGCLDGLEGWLLSIQTIPYECLDGCLGVWLVFGWMFGWLLGVSMVVWKDVGMVVVCLDGWDGCLAFGDFPN